jgi:hypothetical protein
MAAAVERIVVQATAQDKKAIAAKAKRLDLPVSELMRRGAFAYEASEADAELAALADAAKAAAERAAASEGDPRPPRVAERRRARFHRREQQAHRGDGSQGCQGADAKGRLMGVTDKVWGALTAMIKLEDKVNRQTEAMKAQQSKIEDLTGRVIRLEAQLELLTSAAMIKRLKGGGE